MNNLYFIGGPPRTGKTTIMNSLIQERPMVAISFDVVEGGLRKALFGESFVDAKDLRISGEALLRTPGEKNQRPKKFNHQIGMGQLGWRAVIGQIEHYDMQLDNADLVVEGAGIMVGRVQELSLANFAIRAAFVGFTDEGYADVVLAQAKANPSDWLNIWLKETDGDETSIREMVAAGIKRSKTEAKAAAKYGYGFFDITKRPFEEHVKAVQEYLLAKPDA